MSDYSFDNLSPVDFEILARDLAQAELKVRFETFKAGPDKGIDFRCCQDLNHKIIIQCKHYFETGFKGLYQELVAESAKLKDIDPERYLLVTSVPLSVAQKDKIFLLFKPFIKSTGDIWGKGDINNLLRLHPKI